MSVQKAIKLGIAGILVFFVVLFFYYFFQFILNPASVPPGVADSPGFTLGFFEKNSGDSVGASGRVEDPSVKIPEDDYVDLARPYLGNPKAPIKIVEFADFQCPFSKQVFPTIRQIIAKYPEKIFFQYRDFPLITIHPYAFKAALAGRCAHAQGKFWPLHDRLYIGQSADVNVSADFKTMAEIAGLDVEKFLQCVNGDEFESSVQEDLEKSIELGFRGTPTFVVNGYKIEGAISEKSWDRLVQAALRDK